MVSCETCECPLVLDGLEAPDKVYMCHDCAKKVALELMVMAKDKKRAAREARDVGLTRIMFDYYAAAYECIVAAHDIWRKL